MATSIDDIYIVRVTADDYDKVMAIRTQEDVYYGYDYLPSLYHTLINSPNSEGYAAVVDDKFVGFCLIFRVDDGQTLVKRAVRVSKTFEGRGVLRFMTKYLEENVFNKPMVLHLTETFNNESKGMFDQIERGNFQLLFQKRGRQYAAKIDDVEDVLCNLDIHIEASNLLEEKDLQNIFCSPRLSNVLFPNKRIITHWVPYKVMESNVPFIFLESNQIVGTHLNDTSIRTSRDEQFLLTSYLGYPVTKGILVIIDVHGHIGKYFEEHLVLHLQKIIKCTKENISVDIFCSEEEFDLDLIMLKYGFRHEPQSFKDTLFCAEKSLREQ